MRRLLIAVICGVALAVTGHAQALAYGLARANGHSAAKVVSAAPLTVTGTTASGWDEDDDSDDGRGRRGGDGRDSVPVTARIVNPNTFHYWAHTVTASVLSTDRCAVKDFTVEGSPRNVNLPVAADGTLEVRGISVRLAKKASGGCKHATVTLAYSVN